MSDCAERLKGFVRGLGWRLETASGGGAAAGDRAGGPRAAGPPRSANGASSFHLVWRMPSAGRGGEPAPDSGADLRGPAPPGGEYASGGPGLDVGGSADGPGGLRLVEVSAVLEILVPPVVPALYFWALQVDFVSEGRVVGGAHTGLQWNRRYPGGTAVNWGGYASQERGGGVLSGSRSALPGFADEPNTLSYRWRVGRPYRLRVFRSPEGTAGWRATVTDLVAGEMAVVRDLYLGSPTSWRGLSPQGLSPRGHGRVGSDPDTQFLSRPIVWSEVFAACDAPSVTVRWSDLIGVDEHGLEVRPVGVSVNYQAVEAGGCSNTDVRPDGQGYLQVTNAPRLTRQDTVLPPLVPRAFARR